jgi:hypothetical protein
VWSVECGVWSVECGVWSVECGVWSLAGCHGGLQPSPRNDPKLPKEVDSDRLLRNYEPLSERRPPVTPLRSPPNIAHRSTHQSTAANPTCGSQMCRQPRDPPAAKHPSVSISRAGPDSALSSAKNAVSHMKPPPPMEFRLQRAARKSHSRPAPELMLDAARPVAPDAVAHSRMAAETTR